MPKDYIIKYFDDKAIVWFENFNKYVLTEKYELKDENQIETLKSSLSSPKNIDAVYPKIDSGLIKWPKYYNVYQLNGNYVAFHYESKSLQDYINPKFDHLNTEVKPDGIKSYYVFVNYNHVNISFEGEIIYSCKLNSMHELSGKLSMIILNTFHEKADKDWLAVFHASFVSKDKGILFIGDSGKGKSTAALVLQAHKMNLIADDFVPMNAKQKIEFFPAALSVKETLDHNILSLYPELTNAKLFKSNSKGVKVKYLRPQTKTRLNDYDVSAVISLNYNPQNDFSLTKSSTTDLFTKLIPDTWVSQVPNNVNRFLDWAVDVPYYELNYSNNKKFIKEVSKLCNE